MDTGGNVETNNSISLFGSRGASEISLRPDHAELVEGRTETVGMIRPSTSSGRTVNLNALMGHYTKLST